MKLVINADYGGFFLTKEMVDFTGIECGQSYGGKFFPTDCSKELRANAKLVEWVEAHPEPKRSYESGDSLAVVEIPDGSYYLIYDYDGSETVYYSASPIKSVNGY